MAVNLDGFGYAESIDKSANYTAVSITDSGIVLNFTATATLTLPATVVGNTFVARVGKSGITLSISPAAADNIGGAQLTAVDDKDLVLTNQPVGSFVELVADGVNGYRIARLSGTATKEA
jgi:hypothetical protein